MRAVEGCEFVVFLTTPGQSQVQFYSGLHAIANRLVLHVFSSSHCVIFANVTFSSLVCSLFATWLSPYIMHGDCSSWCTRPTSQITGQRMRSLKSNAELEMLTAFKTFLTMMFLCCGRQRASCRPSLSVRQLLGSVKRVRLSTLSVLDMSFRVIGVRAGLFWARVACVRSSSLLLIVCTSSCICFATRIALCVCCFLSIFVVARPSFVYVSCSGRFDLLAVDGVRALVRCRGHRFGGALHDSVF